MGADGDGGSAGESDGGESSGGEPDDPGQDCAGVGAGLAPMRRLTKAQYDNTVRDLFDGAVEPGPTFPVSVIHEEYSNNPAANVVSLSSAEDILLAAEHAGQQVVDGILSIVSCDPGPACAEAFIDDFGRRAFRRPLTASERQALLDVYAQVEGEDGFADGIGTVVTVVLQAPQFLYLFEEGIGEPEPGVVELGDYELATRLSYLLWDTTPDAELLALADAGQLRDPEQLRAQAERLLADHARSGPALDRFFREWMHFDGVPAFEKDAALFPAYDDALAAAMDEELTRFVDGVLQGDAPTLRTLLTSSTTAVDATLAAFYGVEAPAEEWGEVSLPAAERPGLLSRPALLAEHSTASSSAPIFRGRLIRTQLLCDSIPPPPDDAMANAPQYPAGATERERTEILMDHMNCGACHALMNPIGLGFERFDATGAWRELDVDGGPVDARGEIVGGPPGVAGAFDGVPELGQRLADNDAVTACFARQLYRHALGLDATQTLECASDPIEQAFVAADGDIPTLVVELVTSNAFRMRVLTEQE
jgi:Protein of unknown function (DUF1592)/Protein of unknown function (DUF1588)/Protein of unknown function (DUF1595)/Protein of unknown function (DUF1587)/Protein of unknown function (DUF1585)